MPTHVYANNNEIASKASDGKSIAAFPDVCFSPPAPPVGPMPLPYPNTGEAKDTDNGSSKVFIKDKMSGMGDISYFSKSMGDESATQNFNKAMITSALLGKCYFSLWSMDVQIEGKNAPRHLDMTTHNHGSVTGDSSVTFKSYNSHRGADGYVDPENKKDGFIINLFSVFTGTDNSKYFSFTSTRLKNSLSIDGVYSNEKDVYKIHIKISNINFDERTAVFDTAEYYYDVEIDYCIDKIKTLSNKLRFEFVNEKTLNVFIPVCVNFSFNSPKPVVDALYVYKPEIISKDVRIVKTIDLIAECNDSKEDGTLLEKVKNISAETMMEIFTKKMSNKFEKKVDSYVNGKACIIGIRAKEIKYDYFNDVICLVYKTDKGIMKHEYEATTEAGITTQAKRLVAINPGCYLFYFGIHKSSLLGKKSERYPVVNSEYDEKAYPAMVQGFQSIGGIAGNATPNSKFMEGDQVDDVSGVNIHCACAKPLGKIIIREKIGGWSTACQVFKSSVDFNSFFEKSKNLNVPKDCNQYCMDVNGVKKNFTLNGKITNYGSCKNKGCEIYYVLIREEDLSDVGYSFLKKTIHY